MAQQIKYNELLDEDLNKEVLLEDNEFLADAMSFLEKRTGKKEFDSTEEVYDSYMEHMRFHDTNEVTAVRDLMYAQEADETGKEEFARLLDVYDRMEGDPMSWQKAGDYLEAGVTAPSTWLGMITGGAGKMTGAATAQVAKTGVRAVLGQTLRQAGQKFITAPSVVKGMAVEGAIGLGTGAAQEAARVETGAQEEFTGTRTLTTGISQAVAGAIPAAIGGAQQAYMARRATGIREAGESAMTEAAEKARENVQKTLSSVKDKSKVTKARDEILSDEIKSVREFLDTTTGTLKEALDPAKVQEGMTLLNDLSKTERMIASLDNETIDSITAAAIKLGDEIELKPGDRITTGVTRAIEDGKISTDRIDEIMQEFNLTSSQFSYMYMAELSRAGRTLASASKLARETGLTAAERAQRKQVKEAERSKLKRLADATSEYLNQTGGGMTKQEAIDIAESAGKTSRVRNAFQELDRFRLAMMTGQLATTVRNVAGGSFRIATDVFDKSFKNLFNLGKDYDDPLAIAKYAFFNQAEAKVVREMFQKTMPAESERFFSTFFESAVTPAKLGGEGILTKTGATINTLNRLSDNMYKQAIFAGRLDQLTRKTLDQPLAEVIAEGKFAQLDKGMIKDAIQESLDFVYQKTPTGDDFASEAGRTLLDLHRKLPFVVSTFIPFPRFVINQFNFVSQHMPVFGMMTNKLQKDRFFDAESLGKQASGLGMLSIAYDMRERNGIETEWYQYETEDGKTIDMRPIAGPFNAYLLAADALFRYKNDEPLKKVTGIIKDGWQALGGPAFRAGTGLYAVDRLFEDPESLKFGDAVGTWLGDTINTFTLPAATIRDFVSLTDEEKRLVPETGYIDFFDIIAARATRSLPEIPGLSISETLSETLGTGEVRLREERPVMETGEPLRSVDPLERQLFGVGKSAEKNALQRKLTALQMSPYDLYKPSDFPYEDRLMRLQAGDALSKELNKIVQSEGFNNLDKEDQRLALKERANVVLGDVRDGVKQLIESPEYSQYRFERLPTYVRSAVRNQYEKQYPEDEEMDYNKALDLVEGVRQRARGAGYAEGGSVEATEEQQKDNDTMENVQALGELALSFVPVVGDVIDAKDFYNAVQDDDYVGAAISAIGFVPIVGNAMKSGLKATRELYDAADPLIKRRAISDFVRDNGYLPDLDDADEVSKLVEKAAKQEKIVAGMASKKEPVLFHGSRSGGAPTQEGMRGHKELGDPSLSTSRDPLYSMETFAKGDPERMYVLRPKSGTREDMTPEEYDRAVSMSKDSEAVQIPIGPMQSESALVTQLPKSMYTEAETIVQDIAGDVEISKLTDNPKLLAKVQKGMEELDDTYNTLGEAAEIGFELRDAATANEFYSKVANGMKKAMGLGAYTSGAGARGTYDQILGKIAGDNPDFDGLINSMEESVELLTDNAGNLTQRGEKMQDLVFALRDFKDAQEFAGAQEAARSMRTLKDEIMDLTTKMNRGGLASKR